MGGIFASSFLGIGALGGFTGIVWMLQVYIERDADLRRTAIAFIYFGYILVIASLVAECVDLIESAFQNKPPEYALVPLAAYGPGLVIAIAATRKWFMPYEGSRSGARAQFAAVNFQYAYMVLTVIVLAPLNSLQPSEWRSLDDWKVYLALSVSLFFPAVTVIAYTRSLPASRHSKRVKPISPCQFLRPLRKRLNRTATLGRGTPSK